MKKLYFPAYPGSDIGAPVGPIDLDLDPAEPESATTPSAASNPNEIIPTPANGMLHDLIWGTKKIVDADAAGEESWETIFDRNVMTTKESENAPVASGQLGVAPSADTIKVTFNGEVFTVSKQSGAQGNYYGEVDEHSNPVFETYPFFIADGTLYTESAGTYSLKIEELGQSGGGSGDFSTAEVTIVRGEDGTVSDLYTLAAIVDGTFGITNVLAGDALRTLTAVLYKGKQRFPCSENPIISGNAVYNADSYLLEITGNCVLKGYQYN